MFPSAQVLHIFTYLSNTSMIYILNLDHVCLINDLYAALLHLAPNSPDAQVFYQFANSSNGTASSTPSTGKFLYIQL